MCLARVCVWSPACPACRRRLLGGGDDTECTLCLKLLYEPGAPPLPSCALLSPPLSPARPPSLRCWDGLHGLPFPVSPPPGPRPPLAPCRASRPASLPHRTRPAVTTSCGHTFCKPCFSRANDHSNKCPMCRTVRPPAAAAAAVTAAAIWLHLRHSTTSTRMHTLLRPTPCSPAPRLLCPHHAAPAPSPTPLAACCCLQVLHVGRDLCVTITLKNLLQRSFPSGWAKLSSTADACAALSACPSPLCLSLHSLHARLTDCSCIDWMGAGGAAAEYNARREEDSAAAMAAAAPAGDAPLPLFVMSPLLPGGRAGGRLWCCAVNASQCSAGWGQGPTEVGVGPSASPRTHPSPCTAPNRLPVPPPCPCPRRRAHGAQHL